MKQVTVTRKIKIYPVDKEDYKKLHDMIYWGNKIKNEVYRHMMVLNEINKKDHPYIEDIKLKVKTNGGNAYQVAKQYKKHLPDSSIYAACCNSAAMDYKSDFKEMYSGNRSARVYRRDGAVNFAFGAIKLISKQNRNYVFTFCKIPCKTHFGKDMNGKGLMFDKVYSGITKFSDSKIFYDKNKKSFFLLMSCKLDSVKGKYIKGKSIDVKLGTESILSIDYGGKRNYEIGNYDDFLHARLSIRFSRYRLAKSLRYNKGGRGRNKKMKKLDMLGSKEKDYCNTRMHVYSRALIDYCKKNRVGIINLMEDYSHIDNMDEEMKKVAVSSYSYHGLKEKILYKSKMLGIEVKIIKGASVRPEAEVNNALGNA